jgi:hypothetical protein
MALKNYLYTKDLKYFVSNSYLCRKFCTHNQWVQDNQTSHVAKDNNCKMRITQLHEDLECLIRPHPKQNLRSTPNHLHSTHPMSVNKSELEAFTVVLKSKFWVTHDSPLFLITIPKANSSLNLAWSPSKIHHKSCHCSMFVMKIMTQYTIPYLLCYNHNIINYIRPSALASFILSSDQTDLTSLYT